MSTTLVRKQHVPSGATTFRVVERRVQNRHKFQLYVDFGVTTGGPWIKFGVNDTEVSMGYLPKGQAVQKVKVLDTAAGE